MTQENTLLLMIDYQTRLMPSIHRNSEIEQAARILLEGCRLLDVPVFVTQQYTKGLGPTVPLLAELLDGTVCFEKMSFSCMKDELFQREIEKTGKTKIIVAGVESHICVQQTVLDLLAAGYDVYLVADAVSSRKEQDHQFALANMRQNGAQITTVEAILFHLLVRADHPVRKSISSLVK